MRALSPHPGFYFNGLKYLDLKGRRTYIVDQEYIRIEEDRMNHDIRKFALRLKLIKILGRLTESRRQLQILQIWKKALISPN